MRILAWIFWWHKFILILCFDFILYHQMEYLALFQHMQVPFTTHMAATWWVHLQLAHTHTVYMHMHTHGAVMTGNNPSSLWAPHWGLWRELVPLLPPEHHTYRSCPCTPSSKLLSHDKSDWIIFYMITHPGSCSFCWRDNRRIVYHSSCTQAADFCFVLWWQS